MTLLPLLTPVAPVPRLSQLQTKRSKSILLQLLLAFSFALRIAISGSTCETRMGPMHQ
jgi:hypothetical protein